MIKYKYKYKYCRSKAWMCDQDGVLQGKPMHRDDCHYIITVSSQIQIRISAISFLLSQLLPISNDCQFCSRYDCHHHQRSVGLLMCRSSSAKISGPNVKVFCVAISKAICSRGRMRRTPMGISASAAFCLCWTWRSMCICIHCIQIHKYKHILMDDMNGYLYICCTQLILRCKTVAFETESGEKTSKKI